MSKLYDIDIEKSILGCILVFSAKKTIGKIPMLREGDFSDYRTKKIYKAMCELYSHGVKIDILTVLSLLRKRNILKYDDDIYLAELTTKVLTASHIIDHAWIVKEYSLVRKLLSGGQNISEEAKKNAKDLSEQIIGARRRIDMITKDSLRIESKESSQLVENYEKEQEKIKKLKADGRGIGISVGFRIIDERIGFTRGQLAVLIARPSVGKSALALNFALGAVMNRQKVIYITLEMTEKEVMDRILSIIAKKTNTLFKYGNIDYTVYAEEFKKKYKGFHLYHQPHCTIEDIEAITKKDNFDLIIIDYLGLMDFEKTGVTKNETIGQVTRRLKVLAGETESCILLVSQVRRYAAMRKEKMPSMDDARDSGHIEQDADVVLALNREKNSDQFAKMAVLKNRTGRANMIITLDFFPKYTLFKEIENE